MKNILQKLFCLSLITTGISFYACQQEDECMEEKQQPIVKESITEARNNDGTLYCNVTTTAVGQVDSIVTALATIGDYPREGITHLTISGPIDNNDIKAMCNFQYLDSLILTDAKIEKISQNSFSNFKSKAHIILPKTVKTIERYAFHLNYNNYYTIKSVYIQDSVQIIGESAFYYCKGMESIRLPQNIIELPQYCFSDCENLKKIIVPKYVKKINRNAFSGCATLKKIELPNNITEMGSGVFTGCTSLDSIQWPNFLRYIPDYCFANCSNLKFEIPEYIESIGAHAFSNCKKITEYKIPAKVESIGEYAFEGTGITTLTLTDKTMVTTGLFNGSAMTNLTISEGVISLPSYIFQNCDNLTSVKFPSTMKTIGGYAFNYCDKLVTIEFNENLETIGQYAFYDNNALQSVTIPAKTINQYAFAQCDKLNDIAFKDKVEIIGDYAFSENNLLQNVTIPAKTIGNSAFYNCKQLSEVEWNEGLETIGNYAFYYTALTVFKAPSTLKSIGNGAFYYDESLTDITLNEGLTSIGNEAFGRTSINTVTIPSTLEKCGNLIFNYCSKLTSVFWNSKISAPDLTYEDRNILLYLINGLSSSDNPIRIVNGKSQTSILLSSKANYHCPESFVSDMQYDRIFNREYDYFSENINSESNYDKNYSFQNRIGEASCWQTIVLPFEVTSIKCGDKELVPFGAEKEGAYPFWLRELTPNGFVRATKIEANKPYIIAMPNNEAYADEYNIRGKVSFYAENVTIPVTEELKEVQGPSFNFYPTYTWLSKDAEKLVLNRINEYYDSKLGVNYYYGSVFVPSQYDLGSFGAYVSSPSGSRSVIPVSTSLSSRKAHKLGPIPQESDM